MNPQLRRRAALAAVALIATLVCAPGGRADPAFREQLPQGLDDLRARKQVAGSGPRAESPDAQRQRRHYDVHVSQDLNVFSVRRCLEPGARDKRQRQCRDVRTDLRKVVADRWQEYLKLAPDSRLVNLNDLPWLPAPEARNLDTTITFHLPPGNAVSAPWPLLRRDAALATYEIPYPYNDWGGRIAVGKMHLHTLQAHHARVRLAILDSEPPPRLDEMRRWLQHGIEAISSVYGRFPVDGVQLLVIPVGESRGEVPWGQVMRGGYPAVHLFVDQTDPFADLLDDWTLFHEISHLFIPLVRRSDRWLPEGLASYYQTVSRARSGLIGESLAWSKLLGGMRNGIEQADDERRFRDVIAQPGWSSIRLVYWTGAAILMKADIQLRSDSDNRQSLDWVLGEFQRCCLPSRELWSAQQLLEKFDSIVGRPVFLPLAEDYLDRTGFPDIDRDLRLMGIIELPDGGVQIDRNAPLADVAAGIMLAGAGPGRRRQPPPVALAPGQVPQAISVPAADDQAPFTRTVHPPGVQGVAAF